MKYFLIGYVSLLFTLVSCIEEPIKKSMHTELEKTISIEQFDSLCSADSINNDLHKWRSNNYYDIEINSQITQYLYIKVSNNQEAIYRVQHLGDSLWVSKRVKK